MIINLFFGPPLPSPGCISCSVWFLAPYATFLFPGWGQQGVALLSPPLSCLWMWEAIPFHFAMGRRRRANYTAHRNWLRVHFYRRSSARTPLFLLCYRGFRMYCAAATIAILKIARYEFWHVWRSRVFVCFRWVSLHLNISHLDLCSWHCYMILWWEDMIYDWKFKENIVEWTEVDIFMAGDLNNNKSYQ